ncbi:MAG: hypothetical protein AB7V50_02375 [Vampirovibrionia bacterium]
MATHTTFKDSKIKTNPLKSNYKTDFVTSPIKKFGIVNIDNISDDAYELIKSIAQDTFNRKIYWRPQNIFSIVSSILANKELAIVYTAKHKGLNITIKNDVQNKTYIKVTKGLTKKVILETFIPYKPVMRNGARVGTYRSMELYKIFKAVRYQVDGQLIAS